MIKLFPEVKRPWSDGLAPAIGIEDHRNPYEIYFGLFGGGDGGGGGNDDDPDQMESEAYTGAMVSGASESQAEKAAAEARGGGDNDPGSSSGGTTFGVNGVSKTGSTAQDAAIGWTSGQGTGNAGANYDSLKDATSEQMSVVNDVAAQASKQGLDSAQTQSAVKNALDSYETGSVTRSGNLTDKGQSAVQTAIDKVAADEAAAKEQAAKDLMSAITGLDPANLVAQDPNLTDQQIMDFLEEEEAPVTSLAEQAAARMGTTTREGLSSQELAGMSPTEAAQAGYTVAEQAAAKAQVEAQRVADEKAAAAQAVYDAYGLNTSKESPFTATTGIESPFSESDVARMAIADAGMITDMDPFDQSNLMDAVTSISPSGLPSGPLPDLVDAETDLVARDLTDPNRPGYSGGLPTGLETYTRPDGVTVTRNLAGLTEAQREAQPFSMDVAEFLGSDPYGYELDAQGNVKGMVGTPGMGLIGQGINALQNMIMGPPQTEEDLLNRGAYTGMSLQPDGGDEGGRDITTQATQVDPCPAGYELDPATNQCMPIDVVAPFQLGKREYGPTEMPSLLGTPVSPFQSQLRPTAPDMSFFRPAVNPFGFARGGIVELPKK